MDCSHWKPTGGVRSGSDENRTLNDESGSVLPTIVTPYIYDCFSDMQVAPYLKRVDPKISSTKAIQLSWPEATEDWSFTRQVRKGQPRTDMIAGINVGDTISTPPDGAHTGTKWKSVEGPDTRWFGIVQKVHVYKDDSRSFDVTWLYRPVDTPCCSMKYPWTNELFLSDHCTCQEGRDARVHDNEVLETHSVEWLGTPDTKAEFFIRRLYEVEKRRFVTLKKTDIKCNHKQDNVLPVYRLGDTVLVATDPRNPDTLEPCEITELNGKTNSIGFVRLRKLLRRRSVDPQSQACPPNELVYTDEFAFVRTVKIAGRCWVRVFNPEDRIPTPYDRNGTGNFFYITHRREINDGVAVYAPLTDTPTLRQGFDPKQKVKQLQGLDLYCGCGNFGRGLEDSGTLKVNWTNDIWNVAIHTYMANASSQTGVRPFLGSVDDLLHRGLLGYYSENVPQPGEVDFVSGGSPCPGFSILTSDKTTAKQHKNRSLIASFASFIDFYRPKYGVLENVTTIVQKRKPEMGPTEDFFSQLICAIVGMGYQTQIILGDAWTHGAPQSRPRAFLYFAAPGLRLPDAPQLSHSHPPKMILHGLGRMTNGEPYVQRERIPTAFKFVSAAEASSDLPDIGDAKVNTCVPFPDHRLAMAMSTGNTRASTRGHATSKNGRVQILNIPTRPYGMDFNKTWKEGRGVMTQAERVAFPGHGLRVSKLAKSWGRHTPNMLFPTITTACSYTDARIGGHLMHWDQPRPLTIMEARRAQGIPDDEVLLGTLGEQWKMVGNSVARQMALALGLAFREAWLGSLYEDDGETYTTEVEGEDGAEADLTLNEGVGRMAALSVDELAADNETTFMDFQPDLDFDDSIQMPEGAISASKTPERTSLESFACHRSSMATSIPSNDGAVRSGGSVRKRPFSEMLARGSLSAKKACLDEPLPVESSDEDDVLGPADRRGPTIVRLPSYYSDDDDDDDDNDYF
ncbi:putative modification methylase protein [Phaeoacremonium minimum UCRPA7]|uniref:DNA (cytosine-5-)-methyltransferase n=1 Tax=Phaeoacremonium minimum (strain UCR-PA7) TaxID=1286976 RepID=R8BRK5_PHAM7|nr:putative modification methylase protein [Phaeoacremonium minimum UCRPA7]EOO02013.1 putative modification methylase protein [Phaeoacremonium minimum UCRPA7]